MAKMLLLSMLLMLLPLPSSLLLPSTKKSLQPLVLPEQSRG
jgi:hypothetical protein